MQKRSPPKVTFILPVYNAEKYLSYCLDSIIGQTMENLEILCIDDCSTDSSPSILRRYAAADPRINIINNSVNKGEGATRNIGLNAVNGEFIRMIDPDDVIPENSTDLLLKAARLYDSDFVQGGMAYFTTRYDGALNDRLSSKILVKHAAYDHHMVSYFGRHTTFLYRTLTLLSSGARYDENMGNGADVAFMISLVPHMRKVTLIPDTVYYYRRHLESTVNRKKDPQFYFNIYNLYRRARAQFSSTTLSELPDCYIFNSCCYYFPNNLLLSIPDNFSFEQAVPVLKGLQTLFKEMDVQTLCFEQNYAWQVDNTIPASIKYLVLLLNDDHFAEAYHVLQNASIDKKKQNNTKKQIKLYEKKIDAIHRSRSWRMTSPLRLIGKAIK